MLATAEPDYGLSGDQSTDEACVVDGDVNGFKIHIRKNNGRIFYVAIEGTFCQSFCVGFKKKNHF